MFLALFSAIRARVLLRKARGALFFHRRGEIRDRTFENQSFRASGLSLITAAIVHWNTVYLDRAIRQLRAQGAMSPTISSPTSPRLDGSTSV